MTNPIERLDMPTIPPIPAEWSAQRSRIAELEGQVARAKWERDTARGDVADLARALNESQEQNVGLRRRNLALWIYVWVSVLPFMWWVCERAEGIGR